MASKCFTRSLEEVALTADNSEQKILGCMSLKQNKNTTPKKNKPNTNEKQTNQPTHPQSLASWKYQRSLYLILRVICDTEIILLITSQYSMIIFTGNLLGKPQLNMNGLSVVPAGSSYWEIKSKISIDF